MQTLDLPADAAAALELLKKTSETMPTLVFKKSPRCPISFAAEDEWRSFLAAHRADALAVAEIDVVNERPLARGLVEILAIRHESPQALLFRGGKVLWHDSHDRLTEAAFDRALAAAQ